MQNLNESPQPTVFKMTQLQPKEVFIIVAVQLVFI